MKNFVQTGDNIAFAASQLVHPAHAAGDQYTNLVAPGFGIATPVNLVESGDPVVIGKMVGVANNDALRSTDMVVVSTRGVYNLPVTGNNGVNAAINPGDRVYIDPAAATLNSNAANVPFGIALDAVASGATTVIRVKVQGAQ